MEKMASLAGPSALDFDPRAKHPWAEQGVRKAFQDRGPRWSLKRQERIEQTVNGAECC